MSKIWKWILGIVFVLLIVGAIFAIGIMWQTRMATGWTMPYHSDWNSPMPFDRDWSSPMPRTWNQQVPDQWAHPMMDRRSLVPFGGFFLLGGLVKLVLFLGLLYGAYWLGRRNARIALDPKPAERVDSAPQVVEPAPAPRKRARKVE